MTINKVCIVGASGKLGRYMVQHALDRGYEVNAVCREKSVSKLDDYKDRITIFPGPTNDREVIKQAVAGCDGVLTVLVPWGMSNYSSGTAQAVMDYAEPDARLIFSTGWHISKDGKDKYSRTLKFQEKVGGFVGRLFRLVDIDDFRLKWIERVQAALDKVGEYRVHFAATVDKDVLPTAFDGLVHLTHAGPDVLLPHFDTHDDSALHTPIVAEHHRIDIVCAGMLDNSQIVFQDAIEEPVGKRGIRRHGHKKFLHAAQRPRPLEQTEA